MSARSQAVMDALADAETLRRVAETEWDGMTAAGAPGVLKDADARRGRGRNSLGFLIRRGRYFAAGHLVRECARAAFRAVPALRGDEAAS